MILRELGRKTVQRVRDLPLRSKGLAVIAIPLAGLLAVVIAFYLVQRANQDAEEWVRHTLEVRSQIQMVRSALDESESGLRGYLLTRDKTWLEPYRRAESRLPAMLSGLEGVAGDNPVQLQRVRHIQVLVAARFRQLPESVEPRDDGPPPQAALARSREQLKSIRAGLDELWRAENHLLELRQDHARQVRSRAYAVIAAGMLFIPAGAVLAMLLFTSVIVHRVNLLEENANRLAQGAPVAQRQAGRDEIGALEHSLAQAAALLSQRERDLQGAKAELEHRVDERTAELARANEALAAEVAERKRAEEALAYANERLRAVIEASPVAIVGLDLAGNVTGWNRAAEHIFGWTAAEVIDRPLPGLPDEEQRSLYSVLSAAEGVALSGFETRRRRKDGSLVDVRMWSAPLRTKGGELRGQIAIAADFSDLRRLEEQFAQAQKMEAIGRLAGGVAHDFNNVITVVSGYSQMLLDSVGDKPELAEAAQEILKAADRAAVLASQLLAFSRRQVIQPRVVDLNELIANVHRMLGRVIGEDIELKTTLAPDLARVKADPGQIEQVLMNLVVNARDAMPGGGRILIETANAYLDETFAERKGVLAGPYAMLAVSDTGSGIDPETRVHLFEPFFTTKEKGKGTGLGLSTVYGIVKQHRGDIWVYSEPGKGATFKVYLPQVPASTAAAAVDAQKPASARLGGHETVLLVEDEAGVRKLICDILELHGYRVLEADSGQRALEVAGEFESRIDLLITDMVMPKMGGRELAEALVLLRPDLRVLFLSGYTDQVILDRGSLAAGSDFLPKPFGQETLARKVRAVLDRGMRAAG